MTIDTRAVERFRQLNAQIGPLIPRGAYTPETIYFPNNVVSFAGCLWLVTGVVYNLEPPSVSTGVSAYYRFIANANTAGASAMTGAEIVAAITDELNGDGWADEQVGTDLSIDNHDNDSLDIESSTGVAVTLPAASDTLAGLMTAADRVAIDALGTMASQDANAVAITGGTISGLGNPVAATEAVPKQYVDNLLATGTRRGSVRVAAPGNIVIATALNDGDTLDDVTLVDGDLVGLFFQDDAEENGVYEVAATPARAAGFAAYDDLPGALLAVEEGTTNEDTLWLCVSNTGGTIDTDPIQFSEINPSETDLSTSVGASSVTINSSTGTGAVIPAANATEAGVMTAAMQVKLAGVATGAEVNVQSDWDAVTGDALILNKPTLGTMAAEDADAYVLESEVGTMAAEDADDFLEKIDVKNSIEVDAGQLQLDGDEASPGNDKVYGTDGSGNKGWKDDPAGGGGTGTDLSLANNDADSLDIESSTGDAVTLPAATTSLAGLMTSADKTKLDGLGPATGIAAAMALIFG